jgi:hypothetical protein
MSAPHRPRHVPRLRFRPTTHRDFPECLELLPAWLPLAAPLRSALPDLWLRLLDEPAITTTVMEDLAFRISASGYDTQAMYFETTQAMRLRSPRRDSCLSSMTAMRT